MSDGARVADLARDVLSRAGRSGRYVLGIAGPPGAGKSTLAAGLVAALEAEAPGSAVLMPMDGFHYDDAVLEARGLRARKGAPETFDAEGLVAMLARLRRAETAVAIPVFDRALEISRAGARIVERETPVIVLEGNYILLPDAPWDRLAPMLDRSVYIDVPEAELRRRLVGRWLGHGLGPEAALAKAEGNDLPNARLVAARSRQADVVWRE